MLINKIGYETILRLNRFIYNEVLFYNYHAKQELANRA